VVLIGSGDENIYSIVVSSVNYLPILQAISSGISRLQNTVLPVAVRRTNLRLKRETGIGLR
jgi:hypothetical protein